MSKFNNVDLTPETLQATRQRFADNAQGCIDEVLDGSVVLPSHTSKESYFAWRNQQKTDALVGKNDHTLTFLQCAYWLQTGESVALLP